MIAAIAGLALAGSFSAATALATPQQEPIILFTETFTGPTPDVEGAFQQLGSAGLTKAPDGTQWAPGYGADLPHKNHGTGDKAGPNGTQSDNRRGAPKPSDDGPGYLQLTDNNHDKVGGVLFDVPLLTAGGLDITFEQYQYNSTTPAYPADGIGFFIADGEFPLTEPGAFGGSLGYAQKIRANGADIAVDSINGVDHGYLGVGLDVLGNYGCGHEGRDGGKTSAQWLCAPSSVTLRGPGHGIQGYQYLSSAKFPGLGSASSTPQDAKRIVHITITPEEHPTVVVAINDVEVLRHQMNTPMPRLFKFGFTASTGDMTDVHLIRNLQVSTLGGWTQELVNIATPELALAKDIAADYEKPELYAAGDKVPYTFTVTNTGDTALTDVTIVDDLLDEGSLTPSTVPLLNVGATAVFTGTHTLTAEDIAHQEGEDTFEFVNVATASGLLGEETITSNDDDAVVVGTSAALGDEGDELPPVVVIPDDPEPDDGGGDTGDPVTPDDGEPDPDQERPCTEVSTVYTHHFVGGSGTVADDVTSDSPTIEPPSVPGWQFTGQSQTGEPEPTGECSFAVPVSHAYTPAGPGGEPGDGTDPDVEPQDDAPDITGDQGGGSSGTDDDDTSDEGGQKDDQSSGTDGTGDGTGSDDNFDTDESILPDTSDLGVTGSEVAWAVALSALLLGLGAVFGVIVRRKRRLDERSASAGEVPDEHTLRTYGRVTSVEASRTPIEPERRDAYRDNVRRITQKAKKGRHRL